MPSLYASCHHSYTMFSFYFKRAINPLLPSYHKIEELDKVACSNIQQNLWLCDYKSELTDKMNEAFGTTFGKKYQTLKEIKKSLAATKKRNNTTTLSKKKACNPSIFLGYRLFLTVLLSKTRFIIIADLYLKCIYSSQNIRKFISCSSALAMPNCKIFFNRYLG